MKRYSLHFAAFLGSPRRRDARWRAFVRHREMSTQFALRRGLVLVHDGVDGFGNAQVLQHLAGVGDILQAVEFVVRNHASASKANLAIVAVTAEAFHDSQRGRRWGRGRRQAPTSTTRSSRSTNAAISSNFPFCNPVTTLYMERLSRDRANPTLIRKNIISALLVPSRST